MKKGSDYSAALTKAAWRHIMAAKRNLNLDLTRCAAVFSVVAVHFFLNSGYYNTPVAGTEMLISTLLRTMFMVCVPLFLLLTGYLMSEKQIELEGKKLRSFYGKISSVIIPYVIITVLILIWRIFYQHEELTFKNCLFTLLDYAHYSWYVEMYIGLYLLIPFLNVIWRNLETEKSQRALVIVLLAITTLPTLINIWNFNTDGWWSQPASDGTYNDIIPEWWVTIYPFTYYFIGAYIKKNIDFSKFKPHVYLAVFLLSVVSFGVFNYWRSEGVNFIWGSWCGWNGFQNVSTSVLLFMFINSLKLDKVPSVISKTVLLISKLSFGTYLSSYIADKTIYPILCEKITVFQERLVWAPVMVLVSFVSANIISGVVYLLEKGLRVCLGKIRKKEKIKG